MHSVRVTGSKPIQCISLNVWAVPMFCQNIGYIILMVLIEQS